MSKQDIQRGEGLPWCLGALVVTPGGDLKTREVPGQKGFSLMEVLVGVAILGIVYATLFGLMSTSLKNVSRVEEREKIVRYSQMKLNELVIKAKQGELDQVLSGNFDDKYHWKASIETLDWAENSDQSPPYKVAKIRLAVVWSGLSQENQYKLETATWVPTKPNAAL